MRVHRRPSIGPQCRPRSVADRRRGPCRGGGRRPKRRAGAGLRPPGDLHRPAASRSRRRVLGRSRSQAARHCHRGLFVQRAQRRNRIERAAAIGDHIQTSTGAIRWRHGRPCSPRAGTRTPSRCQRRHGATRRSRRTAKSAEASLERVRKLLGDAKTVQEIVSIEGEVTKRETAVEQLKGQLNQISRQVEFATLTVTFGQKLASANDDDLPGPLDTLAASRAGPLDGAVRHRVGVAVLLPFVPLLVLGGWVARFVARRMRRPLAPLPSPQPPAGPPRSTTKNWRRSVEPGRVAGTQQLGGAEREVERLAAVEPGIAHRLVALRQVLVEDLVAAAQALGDVVARELDVHAAGPRALAGGGRRRSRRSRRRTSSKWRVFWPLGAVNVLPCIGSHAHTTGWPASRTARSSGGRRVADLCSRPCE